MHAVLLRYRATTILACQAATSVVVLVAVRVLTQCGGGPAGKPDPERVHPRSHERLTWSLPIEFERKAVAGDIEGIEAGESNFFTMW